MSLVQNGKPFLTNVPSQSLTQHRYFLCSSAFTFFFYLLPRTISYVVDFPVLGQKGFPIQHRNFPFVFLSLSWKFIISLAQFLCPRWSWAVTLKVRMVIHHKFWRAHKHTHTHTHTLMSYVVCFSFLCNWMCILLCVKSEVLMPVNVTIAVFWHVTSYCLVGRCQRVRTVCTLQIFLWIRRQQLYPKYWQYKLITK